MKPKAYFLVFDGLADWELPHALCEINKSGKFDVVSVGFFDKPVTTMDGLKLSPDITLDKVTPADACIFMVPGGDMWERESHENLKALLQRLHAEKVPIGAIVHYLALVCDNHALAERLRRRPTWRGSGEPA